jgi:hypothetical protein
MQHRTRGKLHLLWPVGRSPDLSSNPQLAGSMLVGYHGISPRNSSRSPGLLLPLLGLEAHLCLGRDRERRRPEMWASGHIYISMRAWVRPCCVTFNGSCVFIKYESKGVKSESKLGNLWIKRCRFLQGLVSFSPASCHPPPGSSQRRPGKLQRIWKHPKFY